MQNTHEKVIERFDKSHFGVVRDQIKTIIDRARLYNDSVSNRHFDIQHHRDLITQLVTERLENIVMRALDGDSPIDPTKLGGLEPDDVERLMRFSGDIHDLLSEQNFELSCAARVEQIKEVLEQDVFILLAKWQNWLNAQAIDEKYIILEENLDNTTHAELVITIGDSGAYSGGNTHSIDTIEPQNQFDLIVRAGLERFAGCPSGTDKLVYVESAHAIWVGCVAINEVMIDGAQESELDFRLLTETLKRAALMYQDHPRANIVLNTRCTHVSSDGTAGMGHFESFVLSPSQTNRRRFNLIHKNSQGCGEFSAQCLDPSAVMVIEAAKEAGFGKVNYLPTQSRYNQNPFSCGPSAVAETMDYLLGLDKQDDHFLGKPDEQNSQRKCDDQSPHFKEVDTLEPLDREDFMRLVQLFSMTDNLGNNWMHYLMAADPELFKCYIRASDDHSIMFPVPSSRLQDYADVAYQGFSVSTSSSSASVSDITYTRLNSSLPSLNEVLSPFPKKNESNDSFEWLPSFLLGVLTHPVTKYSLAFLFLVGIVSASIAFSALASNPVAVVIIHALAATALQIAIPGTVLGIASGALAYYGFFSSEKSHHSGVDHLEHKERSIVMDALC